MLDGGVDSALKEERFAESLQDERLEVDKIHLDEGEVGHEFIGVRFVVQQLCVSPSSGQTVKTTRRVTLVYSRCVLMLSDLLK